MNPVFSSPHRCIKRSRSAHFVMQALIRAMTDAVCCSRARETIRSALGFPRDCIHSPPPHARVKALTCGCAGRGQFHGVSLTELDYIYISINMKANGENLPCHVEPLGLSNPHGMGAQLHYGRASHTTNAERVTKRRARNQHEHGDSTWYRFRPCRMQGFSTCGTRGLPGNERRVPDELNRRTRVHYNFRHTTSAHPPKQVFATNSLRKPAAPAIRSRPFSDGITRY